MGDVAQSRGGCLIAEMASRHWPLALAAMVVLFMAASGTLVMLSSAGWFVDRIAGAPPSEIHRALAIYMVGLSLVAFLSALRFALISRFGERVAMELRRRLFAEVLGLDYAFFESRNAGELAAQMSGDVALVQSAVGSTVSVAVRNSVILVGGSAILLKDFALLMVVALGAALAAAVPLHHWGNRVRIASRRAQDAQGLAVGRLTEVVAGIETVKCFGQEEQEARRFFGLLAVAEKSALQQILHRAIMNTLLVLLLFGGLGLVIWAAALQAQKGVFPRSEMASFVALAIGVAGSAAALGDMYGEYQKARAAADRLAELIYRPKGAKPMAGQRTSGGIALAIRDVDFHYPSRPNEPALRRVSLDVRPGERIALVGPSGAGKSTLFKLLLGLYPIGAGSIKLIGEDGLATDVSHSRGCLTVVPQDVMIFAASAYDNIAFAKPDAESSEVRVAARIAHADSFISCLPQGYDTQLGPRGVRLSGGQRQRIAIARAALSEAPIMLLDEATSALDAEAERAVFDALDVLLTARTSLTIAHRLSTVIDADRIYVFDSGSIIDSGRHEDLLRRCPLYGRLVRLQLSGSLRDDVAMVPDVSILEGTGVLPAN